VREPWEIIQATRTKIAALKAETDPYWAFERRREYLIALMMPMVIHGLRSSALHELNIESNNLAGALWFSEQLRKCTSRLVKYQNELYFTRPVTKSSDGITGDMIERAKQYPFEHLMELKKNMARCPFHNDRDPSFSVNNNYGRCFGACGWHGDTIAFVMAKEGLTFPQAVRRLQ
jgi:hypothetical protein